MITRIIVAKQAIAGFRKAAIEAFPNELLRTLWGRIQGDTVLVHAIRDVVHVATTGTAEASMQDMLAPATGSDQYLGSIHSHPNSTDATPSQADWDSAFDTGEHVFGVMQVKKSPEGKFKTLLEWWEPRAPIQMIYPRVRSPRKKEVEIVDAQETAGGFSPGGNIN